MNPTETAHQNLLFDIQYALNNSLYIVKLVDWSAGRRLPRNSETYGERSSFLLQERSDEEARRSPAGKRPPGTEINGPYKKRVLE